MAEIGKILERSKKNPEVRRWQRIGGDFSNWKKTPKPTDDETHLGHMNDGGKFAREATEFGNWKSDLTKGTKHKEVAKKFDETKYRTASKKETKKLFGLFNLWIGPHYNHEAREIVFAPSDTKTETALGKMVHEIGHGDFATILKHEAAHAWDFSKGDVEAAAKGKPAQTHGYSSWIANQQREVQEAMPHVPDWMRDLKGPMARFAYAAVVPLEMPAIMTEMAHIDPTRYHAAHELYKKHGVDLDGMMTDFYGTKITPPRPKDGSVEKIVKECSERKFNHKEEYYADIDHRWGGGAPYEQVFGYADAIAVNDDMPFPDHRISWLPLLRVLAMWKAAGGGKEDNQS
jgi:hypothetical protein